MFEVVIRKGDQVTKVIGFGWVQRAHQIRLPPKEQRRRNQEHKQDRDRGPCKGRYCSCQEKMDDSPQDTCYLMLLIFLHLFPISLILSSLVIGTTFCSLLLLKRPCRKVIMTTVSEVKCLGSNPSFSTDFTSCVTLQNLLSFSVPISLPVKCKYY